MLVAIAGTRDAIFAIAVFNVSVISFGGDAGVTTRRTDDIATASATSCQRSGIVSSLNAALACAASSVASSSGNLLPGSGG